MEGRLGYFFELLKKPMNEFPMKLTIRSFSKYRMIVKLPFFE